MIQNDLKILKILGSRDGAVLKALASHQRSPGSKEVTLYLTVAAHERNIEVLQLLNVPKQTLNYWISSSAFEQLSKPFSRVSLKNANLYTKIIKETYLFHPKLGL